MHRSRSKYSKYSGSERGWKYGGDIIINGRYIPVYIQYPGKGRNIIAPHFNSRPYTGLANVPYFKPAPLSLFRWRSKGHVNLSIFPSDRQWTSSRLFIYAYWWSIKRVFRTHKRIIMDNYSVFWFIHHLSSLALESAYSRRRWPFLLCMFWVVQ